ncbi:hypothetical protein QTP88_016132 [Uroleucon formosanum]
MTNYLQSIPLKQAYPKAAWSSILAPTLYNIFTADIPHSDDTTLATFADDTGVISSNLDINIAIKTFIALLQQLYNFVSRSTVHTKFIELQNKYLSKKENMELKRFCETRWICQISACIAVKKTFPVILLLLHQISLETKSEKQMEAKSLLFHINFEFIFCLYLFCDTFSEIKIVSGYLQKSDSDLSSSCLLVESLINYLMDFKNTPNKFEDLLKEVELCAQKNNIQLPNEKVKETRFRKLPKQFSSYLTEVATAENRKIIPLDKTALQFFKNLKEKESKKRLSGHFHEKIRLPPNFKRESYYKNCKVCTKNKIRKQTQYQYRECNVPLCVGICFEDFHKSL